MAGNGKDAKKNRRENIWEPKPSSASSEERPEDTALKDESRRKPPRRSFIPELQKEEEDEYYYHQEVQEAVKSLDKPNLQQMASLLASEIDTIKGQHVEHLDKLWVHLEKRITTTNDAVMARVEQNHNEAMSKHNEAMSKHDEAMNSQANLQHNIMNAIAEAIQTGKIQAPQGQEPPLRPSPLRHLNNDDADDDEPEFSTARHHRSGKLAREKSLPRRNPFDTPGVSFAPDTHDTPFPRQPTVPVSPPINPYPKPDRLRSQSVMTTSSQNAREDSVFKVQEVGFFHPALQIDDKNPEGPFITTGKDVIYRDVNMFVASAKRIAKRKISSEIVSSHLQLCLRGSALTWFSTLKESMQGALNDDLSQFCDRLLSKYKLRPSQALDKLHSERYTMSDAQSNRHADEYVQNVVLFGSQCGMTAEASLAMAWKNLDPEIQRDVRRPNDSIDEFSQDLDEAVEYWFLRKTHEKPQDKSYDSGYSSPDAVEAGFQRGLRAGERRASNQGSYPNQQRYQSPRDQQYRQQSNYRQQGNYQGPRDRDRNNRDRFRSDTHHVDDDYAYRDEEFADDPELPPESDVFFNDSAWEQRDGNGNGTTPPFACKRCVRRFRDGDELRDHLINAHNVDPLASIYAHHVQADVYPPTAKGFTMVKAGMPDGQAKDVCVDTGSSISLVDAAFAKELQLEMKYTRSMHLRGIGNQRTTTYVKFPVYIAGIEIWVTAYVIYIKSIRLILGMDTLHANQMDVLPSRNILKIKDKEVPLRYSNEIEGAN